MTTPFKDYDLITIDEFTKLFKLDDGESAKVKNTLKQSVFTTSKLAEEDSNHADK